MRPPIHLSAESPARTCATRGSDTAFAEKSIRPIRLSKTSTLRWRLPECCKATSCGKGISQQVSGFGLHGVPACGLQPTQSRPQTCRLFRAASWVKHPQGHRGLGGRPPPRTFRFAWRRPCPRGSLACTTTPGHVQSCRARKWSGTRLMRQTRALPLRTRMLRGCAIGSGGNVQTEHRGGGVLWWALCRAATNLPFSYLGRPRAPVRGPGGPPGESVAGAGRSSSSAFFRGWR